MAELDINVDIIIHDRPDRDGRLGLGFTLPNSEAEKARAGLEELRNWGEIYRDIAIAVDTNLAKVSAVGVGMRSYSGVAAKTFAALYEAGLVIHMISTSEIKISCVVDGDKAETAVQALHRTFVE